MKKLLVILFVGVFAASANAATLSMLFDDGPVDQGPYPREEVTLMPSETAVISVYIDLKSVDPGFAGLGGQLQVWSGGGFSDGLTALDDYHTQPGWETAPHVPALPSALGEGIGRYNMNFGAIDADLDSLYGPGQFLVAEIVIHQDAEPTPPNDFALVFRHDPDNFQPVLTNHKGGMFNFHPKWEGMSYSGVYTYGKGAPDAGAVMTGYTYFDPLIVHCIIPEPGSMALLVLGGLAALRRRR
jgi:hypothetical protein